MPSENQLSSHTVPVSEFHPNPLLEEELEWFFTEAPSDVALPSNLNPTYTLSHVARVGPCQVLADDGMDDRVEAAHAAGIVERRLRTMPQSHAVLLFAAFEPRDWPERLEAVFGRLTGVAVRLSAPRIASALASAALRRYEAAAVADLERSLECGGVPALAVLRWQAHVAYVAALDAYGLVRGCGPSVVPEGGR